MAVSELKLIKHSVEYLKRDLVNINKIPKRTRGIYVLYKKRANKLKPKGDAYDVVYIGMAGGEKKAGITVHKIETGIDTGDIITQRFVPIEPGETLDNLIRKTKKENARIIIDVIKDIRNHKVKYRKMEGEGSYFTFPSRKDVKEFKRRGGKIL